MGIIVLDNGVAAIFNFDAGNAIKNLIVGDMNIVTHTDIDSGIFNARDDIVFHQPVSAQLREDAIDTGIDNHIIANLKVIARLPHNAIAFILGDAEVLDNHIIARVKNGIIQLAQAIHSGALAILNNTTQMNIIFVDINGLRIGTWHYLNTIAGLCRFNGCLYRLTLFNDMDFA